MNIDTVSAGPSWYLESPPKQRGGATTLTLSADHGTFLQII